MKENLLKLLMTWIEIFEFCCVIIVLTFCECSEKSKGIVYCINIKITTFLHLEQRKMVILAGHNTYTS